MGLVSALERAWATVVLIAGAVVFGFSVFMEFHG